MSAIKKLVLTLMKSDSLNKIYCNFQKINFEVKEREAGVLVVCIIKIA
jgi:hypothetical protein